MLLSRAKPKKISETLNIAQSTVYRVKKTHDEGRSAAGREGSGRPVSVATRKLENAIKRRIRRNPEQSIRKMASELQCTDNSVRNGAIKDTGMKSIGLSNKFLLTDAADKKEGTRRLQNNS